jgi:hypothetical protein
MVACFKLSTFILNQGSRFAFSQTCMLLSAVVLHGFLCVLWLVLIVGSRGELRALLLRDRQLSFFSKSYR